MIGSLLACLPGRWVMGTKERLERWVPPCCEWCGREFEEPDEMVDHRCRDRVDSGLGVEAPMEWDDVRKRPFAWARGELDGIGSGSWKKGKK